MIIKLDKYDGTLIHSRFAYRYFKERVSPLGNIVAFIAPMEVLAEGMIDLEDVLEGAFIYSDLAVNWCWEVPIVQDAFGSVMLQRMFVSTVANILVPLVGAEIEIDGDDIWVMKEHTQGGVTQMKGKASVSIATVNDGVAMGHLGINLKAGKKAPAFAFSTDLKEKQVDVLLDDSIKAFYGMLHDVFVATCKIIKL